MKREIKFRAFQDNQMLKSPSNSNYGLQKFFGLLYEDAPIMQFTDLYDNQGNEIYEGDYLSIGPFDLGCVTNVEGEIVKYEVRVEGCDYILYRQDLNLNWGRLSRLNEMGWDCQIIGNIHEPLNQTP